MDNKAKQRILSLDVGYSNLKIARYNEEGVLTLEKEISAIAKIDNPFQADDDVIFNLAGDYFILGSPALKVPRSLQLNLEKYDDLKAAYPAFVSSVVKKFGGFQAFDKIALGLSLAYKDKGEDILDHLKKTLMIDDNKFIILPQAILSKYAYDAYGLHVGDITKTNYQRDLNVILTDIGFGTMDIISIINGSASSSAAFGMENTGVICIAYDIMDYLYKQYEWRISAKEALTIIDNNGMWKRRGKEYDFSQPLKEFTKKYINNVFNLIEDKFSDSLDNMDGVLIVGGFSHILRKALSDPEIVAIVEQHFPVSFLRIPEHSGEFYNAIGYLKFVEKLYDEGKL